MGAVKLQLQDGRARGIEADEFGQLTSDGNVGLEALLVGLVQLERLWHRIEVGIEACLVLEQHGGVLLAVGSAARSALCSKLLSDSSRGAERTSDARQACELWEVASESIVDGSCWWCRWVGRQGGGW